MKRLIPFIFIATAIFILFLFFSYREKTQQFSQTVRPQADTSNRSANSAQASDMASDTALVSLIPLRSNETLLSTLSVDFNGDGYDDQINAVKRPGSQNIILIVGIYNPRQAAYVRDTELNTGISQFAGFTYQVMDVIGNHTNSLVYSGTLSDNTTVLKIHVARVSSGRLSLDLIGDFSSDGTVFIQQLDRYDSYDQDLSSGTSYPVWVYRSAGANSSDQLQIMYTWNAAAGRYTRQSQTQVAGSALAASELERIQSNTADSFTDFLDGMWYKTSNTEEGIRYLFFDTAAREIIFLLNDTGEVYQWLDSTLRRSGIYLSSVNATITNLTRRFDITLSDVDEIKIKLQDDVRMIIGESTLWDGQYKKLSDHQNLQAPAQKTSTSAQSLLWEAGSTWQLEDGTAVHFSTDSYTADRASGSDRGQCAYFTIGSDEIIQFRSESAIPFFGGAYRALLQDEGETNSIILEPVNLVVDGFTPIESRPLRLTRQAET